MTFIKETITLLKKYYIPVGLTLTVVFLLVSFIAPLIFTQPAFTDNLDFTNKGAIGDTIGGLMSPFIAISASILTFMAFYIQYKANQEVQKQFKIQQFESQFYEMLRLHKENVDEVSVSEAKTIIKGIKNSQSNLISTNGRKAFEELDKELKLIYDTIKRILLRDKKQILEPNNILNKSYHIFFFGLHSNQNGLKFDLKKRDVDSISEKEKEIDHKIYDSVRSEANKSRKDLFTGNSTYLAHLYRHLYLTVKFVANQNESFLSYEQKRKYLRILRAQLSNPEQALLFYNWRSGFGNQWEQKDEIDKDNSTKNKFFTDYRMIHNLYNDIIHEDFKIETIEEFNRDFKKEINRVKDPLFESEEW
jgi:hypothetical protein